MRRFLKRSRLATTSFFLLQNAVATVSSVAGSRADGGTASAPNYFLAAVVRVKDEARFLPEWLAHHLSIGIEHIFVYDNGSTDNIHEVIQPFIRRGSVTYIDWPEVPASPGCYTHFFRQHGESCHWAAFFDADEFLFEREPGALLRTLRGSGAAPAVAINWQYFGSSGHRMIPRGLVTRNFCYSDRREDHHVKVIARPDRVTRYRNSHGFFYRGGRLAVTPTGRRVYGSFSNPELDSPVSLRHYVYRSQEDYDRKVRRGFVDESGGREKARNESRSGAEFFRHNDVYNPPDVVTVDQTEQLLAELGYDELFYAD